MMVSFSKHHKADAQRNSFIFFQYCLFWIPLGLKSFDGSEVTR
jgi:hypothetical protein